MPSTRPFPVLRGSRPVTAARNSRTITPDGGTPRRARKDLSRDASPHARHGPLPHPVPPRRRSASHAQTVAPRIVRGLASRDPKTCRPHDPRHPSRSAAARAPPRASRKRAQIAGRLVSFAAKLLCRCPTTAANPWPPRVGDAHRAVRNTYPKETPCARGGQQDACRPPS